MGLDLNLSERIGYLCVCPCRCIIIYNLFLLVDRCSENAEVLSVHPFGQAAARGIRVGRKIIAMGGVGYPLIPITSKVSFEATIDECIKAHTFRVRVITQMVEL